MGTSLYIAKIIGPLYLIIGIGFVLNRDFYSKVMQDYCKNAFMILFGGILALVFGILIILSHNVWEASWRVAITIFGWIGLIKGIWLTVFPNSVYKFMDAYNRNKGLLVPHGICALVMGAIFTYFGYFAR
ncbi:hypothetical protein ACFL96_06225 [Thermoproteota archaeon]